MLKNTILAILLLLLVNCQSNAQETQSDFKIKKNNKEWKKELSEIEYYVLREEGTERAFSGEYDKFYKKGVYKCKACSIVLFKSENKFDSKSGWPSFDMAIENKVGYSVDKGFGYTRTEIHCNSCGGHLGHVFNDGPKNTTGKRYCVNSVSLQFESSEK
jgi:peptide-methionine (R)-S-oxide reductase